MHSMELPVKLMVLLCKNVLGTGFNEKIKHFWNYFDACTLHLLFKWKIKHFLGADKGVVSGSQNMRLIMSLRFLLLCLQYISFSYKNLIEWVCVYMLYLCVYLLLYTAQRSHPKWCLLGSKVVSVALGATDNRVPHCCTARHITAFTRVL